jgi:signal transduction histidine kinase
MTTLDVLVGCGLLVTGLVLHRIRPVALLAMAAGVLWFAGSVTGVLVLAHRGPLTHLLLLYPRTRLTPRVRGGLVAAAYAGSLVPLVGRQPAVSSLICVALLATGWAGGSELGAARRRSRRLATTGACAIWATLAIGGALRAAGAVSDLLVLAVYEVTILTVTASLVVDHCYSRSGHAAVSGLAVDLGRGGPRTVRDALAEVLGDPSIVVALPTPAGLVDETGAPVRLRHPPEALTTEVRDGGRVLAVIEHDPGIMRNPGLVASVAALTRIAMENSRLQREVRAHVREVEASRRRLLGVAGAERERLERDLETGVQERLARVAELVASTGDPELEHHVDAVRSAVRDLARGVHPRLLTTHGLGAAVTELAGTLPAQVRLDIASERLRPEIEAAAYFVCAEALANVTKYADATEVLVRTAVLDSTLEVQVADDGVGGADLGRGTGLVGLRDRLAVVGGELVVLPRHPRGTTVRAWIPVDGAGALGSSGRAASGSRTRAPEGTPTAGCTGIRSTEPR